jgi:hypothetical protein
MKTPQQLATLHDRRDRAALRAATQEYPRRNGVLVKRSAKRAIAELFGERFSPSEDQFDVLFRLPSGEKISINQLTKRYEAEDAAQ